MVGPEGLEPSTCFCPSCGARRMAETAALLSNEVFPDVPLRQWVISFPFPLRYLFAAHPQAMGKVLGIIYRAISTHLIRKAGYRLRDGATGAVTLIQRFGSALNLNESINIAGASRWRFRAVEVLVIGSIFRDLFESNIPKCP